MEVIEITDLEDFASYENDVDRLLTLGKGKHLNMMFDFIFSWLTAFGTTGDYIILMAKDKSTIVGYCPLERYYKKSICGLKIDNYKFTCSGLWGYADIVADDNYREEVVTAFLEYIYSKLNFCRIAFGPMLADSLNIAIIKKYLLQNKKIFNASIVSDAPHILTETGFDTYIRKKMRRKATLPDVKRCIRRLSELGQLTYRQINKEVAEDELNKYMDRFFDMYLKQWKKNRFTREKRYLQMYRDLASRALRKGILELSMLCLDDKIIAIHYGFLLNNCRYYFTPTYDVEYKKYSPGKILLYYLIEDSFHKKVEFDFMNTIEPYKLEWTDSIQQRVTIDIYSNVYVKKVFKLKSLLRRIRNYAAQIVLKIIKKYGWEW